MSKTNNNSILENTARLFAITGSDNFSIRKLAKEINISPSVIYHYFKDEDQLLKSMFDFLNTRLGQKRSLLPQPKTATQMLKQRINFQLDNSQDIVAVLKYYLSHRKKFHKTNGGFLPDKSSLHIHEVLEYGLKTKEFIVKDIVADSKVITHAINGYLLEYYPYQPQGIEKTKIVNQIYKFISRALQGGSA